MYTYKPRTIAEIKADIEALRVAIERAHDDDLPDMEDDLETLFDELSDVEQTRIDPENYAPTPGSSPGAGLDLVKVVRAFGGIPKEWDT
jgi:hypothetical protein